MNVDVELRRGAGTGVESDEVNVRNSEESGRDPEAKLSDLPCRFEHLGSHRQYWRDIMLAVNDGLVSTFLIVAGVVGGGLTTTAILLTAISGGVAGSISMSAGEYIATKSQNDVMRGEIALERRHIRQYPGDELKELQDLLPIIGLDQHEDVDLYQRIVQHYKENPECLLKVMIALEFGVIEEEGRSPYKAAAASFWLFFIGALPSILPFAFINGSVIALIAAASATAVGES